MACERSGLPLRRFFNTSGMVYRERNVKALLDAGMGDEEAYALLAEDGMLVKRPLVVGEDFVLVGFEEAEWEQALLGWAGSLAAPALAAPGRIYHGTARARAGKLPFRQISKVIRHRRPPG